MSWCKSCGAPIKWIKMRASGKPMPVNTAKVVYWKNENGPEKVITADGDVVKCEFEKGDPATATGAGYISHFSTCPNAAGHRRRR